MSFVLGLLAVVAFLSSVLLMVVVLLQEPKGGGIAAALGGSGMEAVGVNTGSVNKFTSWVAGVWVVACLLHSMWMPLATKVAVAAPGANTPADTGGNGVVDAPPANGGDKEGE